MNLIHCAVCKVPLSIRVEETAKGGLKSILFCPICGWTEGKFNPIVYPVDNSQPVPFPEPVKKLKKKKVTEMVSLWTKVKQVTTVICVAFFESFKR